MLRQLARPAVVNATQAARILGVGRTKFYELVAMRVVLPVKWGKRRGYRVTDLDRAVENLKPAR